MKKHPGKAQSFSEEERGSPLSQTHDTRNTSSVFMVYTLSYLFWNQGCVSHASRASLRRSERQRQTASSRDERMENEKVKDVGEKREIREGKCKITDSKGRLGSISLYGWCGAGQGHGVRVTGLWPLYNRTPHTCLATVQ